MTDYTDLKARLEGALTKADEELKAGGYRPTQWPRTAIAAALTDGGKDE